MCYVHFLQYFVISLKVPPSSVQFENILRLKERVYLIFYLELLD